MSKMSCSIWQSMNHKWWFQRNWLFILFKIDKWLDKELIQSHLAQNTKWEKNTNLWMASSIKQHKPKANRTALSQQNKANKKSNGGTINMVWSDLCLLFVLKHFIWHVPVHSFLGHWKEPLSNGVTRKYCKESSWRVQPDVVKERLEAISDWRNRGHAFSDNRCWRQERCRAEGCDAENIL